MTTEKLEEFLNMRIHLVPVFGICINTRKSIPMQNRVLRKTMFLD